MTIPLLSAIIINWNGKLLVETCVNSLLRSNFKDFEIVIVDCVSTDGSVEFFRERYPQAKIIQLKKDLGPAHAINVGVKNSLGSLVLILNNDVILLPDTTEKLVSEFKQTNGNMVINPVEFSWEGKFRTAGYKSRFGPFLNFFLRKEGTQPFYPSTSCCLTTRKLALQNPMNAHIFMYEDTEWGWRLNLIGSKIKVLSNCYYLHKFAGTTLNHSTRQAFLLGRAHLATNFICFSFSSFIIFLPLIIYHYLWLVGAYIKAGSYACIPAMFKGIVGFFKIFGALNSDRKIIQAKRQVTDNEIARIMSESSAFERKMQKAFENFSLTY